MSPDTSPSWISGSSRRPDLGESLGRRAALLSLVRGAAASALAVLLGEAAAAAPSEEGDLEILNVALALEHEAIALYSMGLKNNLVPVGLRDWAVEFRGDHEGHRDTQVALARERGGRPAEPLAHYEFGRIHGGTSWIRLALEVEHQATKAYSSVLPQIAARDYLLSAAFIVVDEVRHLTVWKKVLGQRIY